MRIKTLTEATNAGTFVGVRLTTESNQRFCAWMDQNLIKNPMPADKLHATLVLNKGEKFHHHPISYTPPVVLYQDTFKIDLLGPNKDVLVLKFDSEFLQKRHMQLRNRYGLSWDWPEFSPHITITHTQQTIETDLTPPDFDLELGREYVEEFNPDATE